MSSKPKNLTGNVYGRLTVIKLSHTEEYLNHRTGNMNKRYMWWCRCECGNELAVHSIRLPSGNTTSCGCKKKENLDSTTHGMSDTPTYESWLNMKQRCYNPNNPGYHNYGGRGIKVADSWLNSFTNFLSDMGERPEGLTLEREDVDGDYEPSNCVWDTREVQARNQRSTVLSEEIVADIRDKKSKGWSCRQVEEYYFNINRSTLVGAYHGHNWKNINTKKLNYKR